MVIPSVSFYPIKFISSFQTSCVGIVNMRVAVLVKMKEQWGFRNLPFDAFCTETWICICTKSNHFISYYRQIQAQDKTLHVRAGTSGIKYTMDAERHVDGWRSLFTAWRPEYAKQSYLGDIKPSWIPQPAPAFSSCDCLVWFWCVFYSGAFSFLKNYVLLSGRKTCTVTAERYLTLLRDHVVPVLQERHALPVVTFMQNEWSPTLQTTSRCSCSNLLLKTEWWVAVVRVSSPQDQ